MTTSLRLSVIDQTPVHGDHPAQAAPRLSVALAQDCEQWGYHRYWLAEHHDSPQFAGPAPEVLITRIASATQRIRVGSGGVMLTHYSAYKVAEVFRVIASLFPGRIDLGIGRAPGGTQRASAALASPGPSGIDAYAQQAAELCGFLRDGFPPTHPYAPLYRHLPPGPSPELWMLGSSGGSAALAGELGMGLALARFIAPEVCSPTIFSRYTETLIRYAEMRPSLPPPQRQLALAVVCAPSDEEARHLAGTAAYRKMVGPLNGREPLLTPDEVAVRRAAMRDDERAWLDTIRDAMVVGSPQSCRQQIQALARDFDTEEIGVVTVTHSYEARRASYRLLASAFAD